jgi:hypothetical protein
VGRRSRSRFARLPKVAQNFVDTRLKLGDQPVTNAAANLLPTLGRPVQVVATNAKRGEIDASQPIKPVDASLSLTSNGTSGQTSVLYISSQYGDHITVTNGALQAGANNPAPTTTVLYQRPSRTARRHRVDAG